MRQKWAKFRSRRRGELGEQPLIDIEALEQSFERSRVPAVLALTAVWVVCSVLLIRMDIRQNLLEGWVEGQLASYNIFAKNDFQYTDRARTASLKEEARLREPEYYRLDRTRTGNISSNIGDFFLYIADRSERKSQGRNQLIPDSPAGRLAEKVSAPLFEGLVREYCGRDNKVSNYPVFCDQLRQLLEQGIIGEAENVSADTEIRIVDRENRISRETLFLSDLNTPAAAAGKLALALFPGDKICREEFQKVLRELIGSEGNLRLDHERTDEARLRAENEVQPVVVHVAKNSLLVKKGETFTKEMRDKVIAARAAMPEAGLLEAYKHAAWSLSMLVAMVFSLCIVSPRIRGDNLRIVISALAVIVGLLADYEAIKLFWYLLRDNQLQHEKLLICALPVAFCPAMLAILLDSRTAICCGALVSGVTAMMIMPDRSLELALRWSAISALAALLVANVTNYRSFFLRTLVCVFLVTWAVNLDVILRCGETPQAALKEAAAIIIFNAVFCAATGLGLIFIFELVFNLSTNMALMVLCDCNHAVLERLKREAPGTMAHSMAVATIAEDAARAIGANPLRAKAGALFHDIGKLAMPQYFTENNPNSALQHANLNPQMSSRVIRDHVTEGLSLARQYRLCRFIREVIASHHGDDLVSFFYRQAQENRKPGDPPVLESQFRYHGDPPTSREAGIISLADACEAASRSLRHPVPEDLAEMVHKIICGRFGSGQLRLCRLTAADLDRIEKSFVSTLSSSMHGRIAYAPAESDAAGEAKKC